MYGAAPTSTSCLWQAHILKVLGPASRKLGLHDKLKALSVHPTQVLSSMMPFNLTLDQGFKCFMLAYVSVFATEIKLPRVLVSISL